MKTIVIGAGNTGKSMACFLKQIGHDVNLYDRNEDKVNLIKEKGIIDNGSFKGHYDVEISTDLKSLISDRDMIFVNSTSDAHIEIAKKLKSILKENQSIVILNGNWGAYEFYKVLKDEIENLNLAIAETSGMIFTSKFISDTEVLSVKKETVDLGVLNNGNADKIIEFFKENMTNVNLYNDIISSSLNASNPVIHVPIVAANLTRIEAGEDFQFYGPAASKLAVDFIVNMDRERLNLCDKLGVKTQSILDIINGSWKIKHDTLYDALHKNNSYKLAMGPKNLNHRYIFEDIPYGIYPIKYLSEKVNLETPYMDGLLDFLNKYLEDFELKDQVFELDYETVKILISGK